MREASSQPAFVRAAVRVGREAGRLIAARRQILGQGWVGSVQRELPLRIQLVWPLAGEKATMRRVSPGRRRDGCSVCYALLSPLRELRRGLAGMAVVADVVARGRYPRRSARRSGRPRRAGGRPATARYSPTCQPVDKAAVTARTPRSAVATYRSRRGSRPRAAIASAMSRPSPMANTRLHAPYSGDRSSAPDRQRREQPHPEPSEMTSQKSD